MAPTPSSRSAQTQQTPSKTPQSKQRLHFKNPSPGPNSAAREVAATAASAEHPVEVITRIRDHPDQKDNPFSALHISSDHRSIRVRTEIGYRDFGLDGVSVSEEEDLEGFYKKFVESRINGVKLGAKCTVMMYGPTGAGKSHTMFGCARQPGIVYRALRDILGENGEEGDSEGRVGVGSFVQVTVLEIYNEEIYDLLANSSGGGLGIGWPKGNTPKVRLEVMGKKAKNATFISGNEAGKISREVAKVEKRRIVKSTLCNERSSRSHCMIILEVPTVGGRLMLVDMAGSENIEQAGQTGFEAKMQTAKINQGNIALKRVVESIANGDSHVPFRDSKLTMLLQDSFEDDKSKILMILCASPDPKEIHKTVATLEYGAKAKCIVRGGNTPNKDKVTDDSLSVILGSRIAAMDQFIIKLQMENKQREKERNEAHKELMRKEEEVATLRAKLETIERNGPVLSEEEIDWKVEERTQALKLELERKLQECQKAANEFVEQGKRRMEEKILMQQEEVETLRRRLEEIEAELRLSKEQNCETGGSDSTDGCNFARRLLEIYADEDPGMEKSMDLDMGRSMDFDMGKQQPIMIHDVREVDRSVLQCGNLGSQNLFIHPTRPGMEEEEDADLIAPNFTEKVHLSTVYEEEEEDEREGEYADHTGDEEVEKEIVAETAVRFSRPNDTNHEADLHLDTFSACQNAEYPPPSSCENYEKTDSARKTRIQNIFMLCGNHRELAKHVRIPTPCKKRSDVADIQSSPVEKFSEDSTTKLIETQHIKSYTSPQSNEYANENARPEGECKDGLLEVYVKWETSNENPGKFIAKLKVMKDSRLADLRKMVEIHLNENNNKHGFTFLLLGDPTGAPLSKEKEASVLVSSLPVCNNQSKVHLASLRPVKGVQRSNHLPFSLLENNLFAISNSPSTFMQKTEVLSPRVGENLCPSPYLSAGLLHR
ncbi:hypothetical protein Syun_029908 [Stephania yunnanensis]|uniref:Kinesin-like protein KIN-10A n=1 Tax=Stephania yunnanensis TaxID=152371 RepID=A0AAP0E6G9_9MAGN